MPFNVSPTGYFPNIVTNSSGVFIPYSNLESYNINTSGDIRQLVYSFIEAVSDQYVTLSGSGLSTQMSINRSSAVPDYDTLRRVYTVTINLGISGMSVRQE